MRKTIIILAVLGLLAAGSAFADFSLGLNGALYMDNGALQEATGHPSPSSSSPATGSITA